VQITQKQKCQNAQVPGLQGKRAQKGWNMRKMGFVYLSWGEDALRSLRALRLIFISSRGGLFLAAGIAFLTMLVWGSATIQAQEASGDRPTPSSVDEISGPMDRTFEKAPPKEEPAKPAHPFFRDQKLDLNLRTFYKYNDKGADNSLSEAWAVGGALTYKSGYFLDHFALGGTVYTSQPLYAPEERDGTLLLKPGQEGYTVLGQLYGEIKVVQDNFFRFYRQEYNTPYINKNDFRMTPNTFEGYSFQGAWGGGKDGAPGMRYGGGYITKIKERNSDEFVWMSRDAGAKVDRGVAVAGLNYSQGPFSIGAINYYSDDIINIFYTEGKAVFRLTKELGLLFSAQYTDQRSVGSDLLKGFDFSTNQFGIKGEMSYRSAILTIGYTIAGKGADLQSPWGVHPGYTSIQVQDFNRAGENATISKLSYDFTSLGLTGVTAYALWLHGWNRVNPTGSASVNQEDEYDFDLQWRPKYKYLKGLWLRTRYAYVDQRGGGPSQSDFRVILNYDIPLL